MDARAWLGDDVAAAVDADIREELEAHLALCEEALRAEGRTSDEARVEARARFGDLEHTLRACRRVRLEGRTMLVRIQWILIALLALSTVAVGLISRQSAAEARTQAERAMQEAQERMAILAGRQREEAVEEIIVRVGDLLDVVCAAAPELDVAPQVQRDGKALFPELGWVDVAGKSRQQVEDLLRARYGEHYEDLGELYVIVTTAH